MKRPTETDNRDLQTTWLHIDHFESDEGYVEVDPWALVMNVLDNSPLTLDRQETYKRRVQQILNDIDEELNNELSKM